MSHNPTASPAVDLTFTSFAPPTIAELAAEAPRVCWLWKGFLARGNVTLLTSQWKTGKSTLLAVLLARLRTGGMLAGQRVRACRAVVVSEEMPQHWLRRGQQLDFGPDALFSCRPFQNKPSLAQWLALIDRMVQLRAERRLDLLAIDTLASFLPLGAENDAGVLCQALQPLGRLTEAGAAVLLMHHPRKRATPAGSAARGSGALPAFADVLIEMQTVPRASPDDRRRRIRTWSRHDLTPRELTIKLSPKGDDYTLCPKPTQRETHRTLTHILTLLRQAQAPLTRPEILALWLPSPSREKVAEGRMRAPIPPPNAATLWRWLTRAQTRGLIATQGTGRRADPYRYVLTRRASRRIDGVME